MALLLYCQAQVVSFSLLTVDWAATTREDRERDMNAPRYEPDARPRPTQTFWPGSRRPESSSAPPRTPDAHRDRDEKKDDDHAPDEPGYGHGV